MACNRIIFMILAATAVKLGQDGVGWGTGEQFELPWLSIPPPPSRMIGPGLLNYFCKQAWFDDAFACQCARVSSEKIGSVSSESWSQSSELWTRLFVTYFLNCWTFRQPKLVVQHHEVECFANIWNAFCKMKEAQGGLKSHIMNTGLVFCSHIPVIYIYTFI